MSCSLWEAAKSTTRAHVDHGGHIRPDHGTLVIPFVPFAVSPLLLTLLLTY